MTHFSRMSSFRDKPGKFGNLKYISYRILLATSVSPHLHSSRIRRCLLYATNDFTRKQTIRSPLLYEYAYDPRMHYIILVILNGYNTNNLNISAL